MPADLTPEGKAEAEQLLGGLGISPNVLTYVYLPQTLLDPCRASDACLSFARIHFMCETALATRLISFMRQGRMFRCM